MALNEEQPAMVRADTAVRMRAIAVALCGVLAGYIALSYCNGYLADLRILAETDAMTALEKMGELFRLGMLTLIGSICAFALLLGLMARRVLNDNRFPPYGMKVIADTRVLTGEAARAKARTTLVVAGTLVAAAFCLLLWAWRSLKALEAGLG